MGTRPCGSSACPTSARPAYDGTGSGACAHSVSYAVLGLCFERVPIGSLGFGGFQQHFQGQALELGPVFWGRERRLLNQWSWARGQLMLNFPGRICILGPLLM